jgi:hypothetical protein
MSELPTKSMHVNCMSSVMESQAIFTKHLKSKGLFFEKRAAADDSSNHPQARSSEKFCSIHLECCKADLLAIRTISGN